MLEICKYLIDELKADTGLDTLLGSTVSDSRIYAWKPGLPITFSTASNGAIYYHFLFENMPFNYSYPSQIPDASIIFGCCSPDRYKASQIAEAILFKFQFTGFSTFHYRVGTMIMDGMVEGVPEGDPSRPVYNFNVNYSLKEVFKTV